MTQKLDPAIASLDLTGLMEKLGYIKRTRQEPGVGTSVFRRRDERTSAQLEAARFSGIRANDMWNRFELWILGNVANTLTYQAFFLRPESLNEMYCETFGIDKINLAAETQRDIEKLQERKALLGEPEVQRALDALASPPAPVSNIASKKDSFEE